MRTRCMSCYIASELPDSAAEHASADKEKGDGQDNNGDAENEESCQHEADEDGLIISDHKAAEPKTAELELDNEDAPLKLFEVDDGKTITVPLAKPVDGKAVKLKASEHRWFTSLYRDKGLDTKIRFQAVNPKR